MLKIIGKTIFTIFVYLNLCDVDIFFQDGRVCRVQFSLLTDRLDLNKNDTATTSKR